MSSYWSVECENADCPLSFALRNMFENKKEAVLFWNTRYAQKYDQSFHYIEKLEKY